MDQFNLTHIRESTIEKVIGWLKIIKNEVFGTPKKLVHGMLKKVVYRMSKKVVYEMSKKVVHRMSEKFVFWNDKKKCLKCPKKCVCLE